MIVDPCIVAIEERAKAAKIVMAELHRRAETHPTTWLRMTKGDVSPRMTTIRKYEAALEEMISEARHRLNSLPDHASAA